MRAADEEFPELLRLIADAPKELYVEGEILPEDRLAVAIVGTRQPTALGLEIAYEMARDLASVGVTVVSGLAIGIDAAAHRGALEKGRTIACLGCGTDVAYPRSNRELWKVIPSRGALISEYPPGTVPLKWHFPQRNRLISGLSLGVVVVEAGLKSGALVTAEWAARQGKPVMAVPGNPKSSRSAGTNKLIQDGAYLVTCAQDVLSFLRQENEWIPEPGPDNHSVEKFSDLSLEESAVLEVLAEGPIALEELCTRLSGFGASRVISLLSALELKQLAKRVQDGRYVYAGEWKDVR